VVPIYRSHLLGPTPSHNTPARYAKTITTTITNSIQNPSPPATRLKHRDNAEHHDEHHDVMRNELYEFLRIHVPRWTSRCVNSVPRGAEPLLPSGPLPGSLAPAFRKASSRNVQESHLPRAGFSTA